MDEALCLVRRKSRPFCRCPSLEGLSLSEIPLHSTHQVFTPCQTHQMFALGNYIVSQIQKILKSQVFSIYGSVPGVQVSVLCLAPAGDLQPS